MPGASSGKRSIKNLTAASYEGASASQKVRAAEWTGELDWNAAHHSSGSKKSLQPQQSYDPAWPYIAYVTENGFPGGPRYPKCLLCDKWCQDEVAHSGTHAAPSGSKEHQKNLSNYGPDHPWYIDNVEQVRLRWHPELAVASPAAAAASAPGSDGGDGGLHIRQAPAQQVPEPAWPYIAYVTQEGMPDGPRFPKCLLCDKWVQDEGSHSGTKTSPAGSKEHAKNLRNYVPDDPWYIEHVVQVRLRWHPELVAALPEAAAAAAPGSINGDGGGGGEAVSLDPWLEMRDGCAYCLACRKFATSEHCATDNHVWRVQQWGQDDIVVTDPWIQKRNGECFCLACDKWATPEHLQTAKHLWRAQVWAAMGHVAADPGDIVGAIIKEVPMRKNKRGGSDSDAIVLESQDIGIVPASVRKADFKSWPLPPRVNDVLLVAVEPVGAADSSSVRPRLRDVHPLSSAELATFAKRLECSCEKSCGETCRTLVAEYYPFCLYALQHAESPDAVIPLLRVLKRIAIEAVTDASEGRSQSAVRVFLLDALCSALIGAAAPQLVASGNVDVTLCQELANLFLQFLPNGLSRVRPLLQASYEQCLKSVDQELIPEIVGKEEFPSHWTTASTSFAKQSWMAVPLAEDGDLFNALKKVLATDPSDLGCESPELKRGSYSELVLKTAWRIENPGLLENYLYERRRLRKQRYEVELQSLPKASFRQPLLSMPQIGIRQEVGAALEELPDKLEQDVNEVRLLAGGRPEDIMLLSREGLNPNANGGKFGKGSHLSEDAGSCDQNAICDPTGKNRELKDLHSKLFTKAAKHPGNIYFIFVCRVVLGHFVRTSTGDAEARAIDGEGFVYSSGDLHELAPIPGTAPPLPYQSLVVEVGDQLRRYREFVQFKSQRIYPEYLLAYQRA